MFEVLGQEYAKNAIKSMYDNNKMSHAFIIQGPDGIGKSIFADYIASMILCRGSKKPCSECTSCKKIQSGIHPDYKIISSSKSIGIDVIRKLIDDVNIKPYEGDKKVIVIKGADKITIEGQNALLKTLEEPLKDTTIIILLENINSILDTIISRCQVLRLGRVERDKIQEYLIKRGVEYKKAKTAACLSDGILGNALKYLDDKYAALRMETLKTLRDIIRADEVKILDSVDFFLSQKENIDSVFDIMLSILRDISVLKITKNEDIVMNSDIYEILNEECKVLSIDRINKIINIINSARKNIDNYLNYQLTIEDMLLNIQEV
ncbi:DNA polymerase III, delta prime subunit [Caloramator quimbayensis]|uniref:DNA polymerase III subunit delta' n=1 Tax=Caloramator quimbayensis TaxID=1147123 RepID=A0A1T4WHL3_9CLOT|nr:DNA polymerase III subunit delta' C-terminal domain-containing protein [Caloramator quimbayensis]SKA76813.1 DNA polymerase III, delta prime subunit [Caloramator quimbayensis]